MRTKKGAARKRAKKKVLKKAKGYRGGRKNLYENARETWMRAQQYAYRDRRARKREFRRLWITRIRAAAEQRDFRYSQFIHGLKQAGIDLNRKMLAELAVREPAAFDDLVEIAKKAVA